MTMNAALQAHDAIVLPAGVIPEPTSPRAALRHRIGAELETLSAQLAGSDAGSPHLSGTRSGRVALAGIHGRIRWLGQLLAGLADPRELHIHPDRAGFGSTIQAVDAHTRERLVFTLMTAASIDVTGDQVSMDSPIGSALVGCRTGDIVEAETPAGARRFHIERVTTLLQKTGGG